MSEASAYQQNDDGSWSPAGHAGWQPGLDWEVRRMPHRYYVATLYHRARVLAVVEGHVKSWLYVRMTVKYWLWRWRLRGQL